jgi:hypothetical protein
MKRILFLLLYIAVLINPAATWAQGGTSGVYVHNTTATPAQAGADGVAALRVRTLFSVLDSAGLPAVVEIDRVELKIGQDRYTSTFGKPSGQWAISVLLDTSGTLAGSPDYRRMIEGLSKSLDRMPENALFTIITYDNVPTVIQEFTADKEEVRKKLLTAVNAKQGAKSCFNDGMMEAVRRVESASARKAVIAVTASQDNCGNTPLQAVIDEATGTGTQIHALGIDGYAVNLATLQKYTTPTKGLAYVRSPNDLIFGLSSMLSGLANQWEANWTLYPPKGEQTVDMTVVLKDSSSLPAKVTFVSDKTYEPPPKIELIGEVRTTPSSVLVNLSIVNRARIARLQAHIVDKVTGLASVNLDFTAAQDSLSISASNLAKDGTYTLDIAALDAQNNVLSRTTPRDFQFKPTPLQIAIASVSVPSLASTNFLVTVTTPGGVAGIARYKAWLEVDQSGGNETGPIPGTEALQSPDLPIAIPGADIPSGSYLVKAQALDGANQIIAEAAKPFKVQFVKPSFIDKLSHDVSQSSVAVIALFVVAMIALIGLFILIRVARSRSRVEVRVVEPELDRKHFQAPASDHSQVIIPQVEPSRPSIVQEPQQSPAGRAMATLIAREPSNLQFQARISSMRYTIGRRDDNDGAIHLDSQSGVSGSHAVIISEGGTWYVQDSNSTNGTFVNGKKLPANGRMRLDDHTVIGLGPKVKLEFRIQS